MGFMVEGSTGARAVAMLKDLPQGTIIDTPEFAAALGVKPGAIHQLLVNAVKLRMVKKLRRRGIPYIGWALGAGSVGTTIEPRRVPPAPPTAEALARRAASAERRVARQAERDAAMPTLPKAPSWPPGFVSTFGGGGALHAATELRPLSAQQASQTALLAPAWLRGAGDIPKPRAPHSAPSGGSRRRYVARWHVRYAGEGGQICGVVQVLKVHPKLRRLDAWCEWRHQVHSFAFDGFSRIDDAETYKPVDLAQWLRRHRRVDRRCAASHAPSALHDSVGAAELVPPRHVSSTLRQATDAFEPVLA